MMQPAESWQREYRRDCRSALCRFPLSRSCLAQAEMCAVVVIVVHAFGQEALQMAVVEDDDMIEQVAPAVADESLCYSILPGASNRNSNRAHSQTLRGFQNLPLERVLAIKDEKLRRGIVGEGLPKLLGYPSPRRMPCDVVVKNAPPVMSNDEETIQHAEGERRNGEEVHGRDGFSMIAQERCPSSCRLGISRSLSHPSQHGPLRDIESQHPEFAMDARRAPGAILGYHTEDQLPKVLARRLPSNYGMFAGKPFPVQSEAGPMPADDRLWLRDEERLLPSGPQAPQQDPKDPIRCGEARPRMTMLQRRDLMPQGKVLQEKVAAGTQESCNEHQKKVQQAQHGFIFAPNDIPQQGPLNSLIQQ
jgi:hypothetical protein